MTRVADLEALVAKTVAAYGRIDVLVNNAGTIAEQSQSKRGLSDKQDL